ncbi:site-specific recombinase, phage integrase family [Leptospira broomii serovar Hurstbridge str. 5399]|uniref:Site-specific recombinase, phage integrase family n=1 Tax=Leptospira broomii serovar Hurstbridge str. 5399 TaxID=1049789 RepID=T0F7W7_9LEPT|nr:site-specific recombinase, phage integrase family [Leptospira broomii serovar Hurstbridge str. 5399]
MIEYTAKGGKTKYAVLTNEILKAIKKYHKIIEIKSDYFFLSRPKRNQTSRTLLTTRSLQRIVNSWNEKTCQGKLVHPHAIRHSVGQRLLEKAGSIAAQKALDPSSPITTAKFYAQPYFDGPAHLTWD